MLLPSIPFHLTSTISLAIAFQLLMNTQYQNNLLDFQDIFLMFAELLLYWSYAV
jgi:hypothetical protein